MSDIASKIDELIAPDPALADQKVHFNTVTSFETIRTAVNELNRVAVGEKAKVLDSFIESMVQCAMTMKYKGD